MELSFAFRNRCESIATDVRYELARLAFDPLCADVLAQHLRVRLFRPSELEEAPPQAVDHLMSSQEWSAILLVSAGHPEVLYNPNRSPARTESDIMHELGHWLLKHSLQAIRWHNGIPYRDFDAQIESEAAYLGGALQVPRRAILWCLQHDIGLYGIADRYGCSPQMAQWRLNASA